MDWVSIALLVVNSGALMLIGSMNAKLKYLCLHQGDHETRLRRLEYAQLGPRPLPQSPTESHHGVESA